MTRPFVVLFLGRSGSTYLMEALDTHPAVEAGLEELGSRRETGRDAQLEFARSFFSKERDPAVGAAGFKTKLQDVLDPEGFARLLGETGAYVILLQRRNVVKAVVSWFRSEIVNRETGDWNLYRADDRPAAVEIDPAEFATRVRGYEETRGRLQDYVLGLERPTLMLFYEDLLADAVSTLGVACGFLGVERLPLRGRALKATPDDLRSAVANVEELRDSAGSRHRPMFEDGAAPGP